MNYRYIIITLAALMLASGMSDAQELDPTVVVNKAYEGKLVQVHKPAYEMAVPDSVTKFNLDFDYLIFDQPYKGADGFTPYALTMKPASMVPESNELYLEAGAGYTLHPTLDVIWSPLSSKVFQLDVYANHRSYVGDYRSFRPVSPAERTLRLDRWEGDGGKVAYWCGYDLMSRTGVDGRFEGKSLSAGFDVSYYGLHSEDFSKVRSYDGLDVKLGLSSKPKSDKPFSYDALVTYRFAEDKLNYKSDARGYLNEHLIDVDAKFGYALNKNHKVLFDVESDVAIYSPAAVSQLTFVPHYLWKKGRFSIDAGLRVSAILRSQDSTGIFDTEGQVVYPDVKASYFLIPDAMKMYVLIGGGSKLNTYASLLEKNHHADPRFAMRETGLMNVTVERVSASLGIEGRIGSAFSYNLHTGYVNYASDVLDAVMIATDPVTGAEKYLPGLEYAPYQKYYASADWSLLSDNIRFDGEIEYTYAWGLKNSPGVFLPAALTGDVSFEYNWSKRIFAGIDCDFSTGRHGSVWVKIPGNAGAEDAVIPGYVDLGVNFEYAFNNRFSVWARGGNLLNMTIQRNPLYAEKGLSLTVGICLNL